MFLGEDVRTTRSCIVCVCGFTAYLAYESHCCPSVKLLLRGGGGLSVPVDAVTKVLDVRVYGEYPSSRMPSTSVHAGEILNESQDYAGNMWQLELACPTRCTRRATPPLALADHHVHGGPP